jgi:hypothetical protein
MVDAPISAKLSCRNSSPKPGIALVTRGSSASGVTSRAVIPVPPVTITTSTRSLPIQSSTVARIWRASSVTMRFSVSS